MSWVPDYQYYPHMGQQVLPPPANPQAPRQATQGVPVGYSVMAAQMPLPGQGVLPPMGALPVPGGSPSQSDFLTQAVLPGQGVLPEDNGLQAQRALPTQAPLQVSIPTYLPPPSVETRTPTGIDAAVLELQRSAARRGSSDTRPQELRRYPCPFECPRSFAQRTHLTVHIRKHTGETPFQCSFEGCTAAFSQQGNLKTHIRRHTGFRPFECPTCGRGFAQSGNLKQHQKIHSGEKPFICRLESCGKTFTQRGNLKQHQSRFHQPEIDRLREVYANGVMNDEDKLLSEHLLDVFKFSNMGIKGRGKGRQVNTASSPTLPASSSPVMFSSPPALTRSPSQSASSFGVDSYGEPSPGGVDMVPSSSFTGVPDYNDQSMYATSPIMEYGMDAVLPGSMPNFTPTNFGGSPNGGLGIHPTSDVAASTDYFGPHVGGGFHTFYDESWSDQAGPVLRCN